MEKFKLWWSTDKDYVNDSEGVPPPLHMKNMAPLKARPDIATATVRLSCDAALVGEGVGPSAVPGPVESSSQTRFRSALQMGSLSSP